MKAILFLILLGGAAATAQQTDTIKRYLDEQLNFTSKNKAVYTGFSVKKKPMAINSLLPHRHYIITN